MGHPSKSGTNREHPKLWQFCDERIRLFASPLLSSEFAAGEWGHRPALPLGLLCGRPLARLNPHAQQLSFAPGQRAQPLDGRRDLDIELAEAVGVGPMPSA